MDRFLAVMSVTVRRPDAFLILPGMAIVLGMIAWVGGEASARQVAILPAMLLTTMPFLMVCVAGSQAMQLTAMPQMAVVPRSAGPHAQMTVALTLVAVTLSGGLVVDRWDASPGIAISMAAAATALLGPWAWIEFHVRDSGVRIFLSAIAMAVIPLAAVASLANTHVAESFMQLLRGQTRGAGWVAAVLTAATVFSWSLFVAALRITGRGLTEQGRVMPWGPGISGSDRADKAAANTLSAPSAAVDRVVANQRFRDLPKLVGAVRPGISAGGLIVLLTLVGFAMIVPSLLMAGEVTNVRAWVDSLPKLTLPLLLGVWLVPIFRWRPVGEVLPRLSLTPTSRKEFVQAMDSVIRKDVIIATAISATSFLTIGVIALNGRERQAAFAGVIASAFIVPAARAFLLWVPKGRHVVLTAFVGWLAFSVAVLPAFMAASMWTMDDAPALARWAFTPAAFAALAGTVYWLRKEQHWWATADLASLERQGQ